MGHMGKLESQQIFLVVILRGQYTTDFSFRKETCRQTCTQKGISLQTRIHKKYLFEIVPQVQGPNAYLFD